MLFGEMGNGKSTTGNFIIKEQLKKTGDKFVESVAFKASKSVQAVTTQMLIK
jgi:ABC-type dipeptide/oligopeptide/nickel transport system ATPase subunit